MEYCGKQVVVTRFCSALEREVSAGVFTSLELN